MLPLMIFACIATVTVATTAAWQGSSGWSGVASARGRLRRCRRDTSLVTRTQKSLTPCYMAIQEATFGMGCFWKPSEELLKVPGVVDTVVGYSGNAKPVDRPPTYETVCFGRDWVEAVRVRYDDDVLSYHQLLDAFFETQEPKLGGSRQYASIIFAHSNGSNRNSNGGGPDNQAAVAQQWLDDNRSKVRRRDNVAILQETTIEAPSPFYKAEEYHQRYWQKLRPRFAIAVLLLAVNMGALDAVLQPILSFESLILIHRAANIIVLLGLVWVLVERAIDTKTVEL
jgi:peptide-methionine (S)-S-oxide reductase